uniref:hypothetical protein n=1 Tax=Streptomyces sp. IBSBF 2435 TaxID=2903531 RepID=UPI002FDC4AEA
LPASPAPAAHQEPSSPPAPSAPSSTPAAEPADSAGRAGPPDAGDTDDADPADRADSGRRADDMLGLTELFGETAEEAALRDLMREAVRDLKPTPDALDHLRRAVPARRQHRRQALAGSAAAVLLVGTAVPALIHAAGSRGGAAAAPANVASAHTAQPGEDGRLNSWGAAGDSGQAGRGPDGDGPDRRSPAAGGTGGPSSMATSPGGLPSVDAPACSSSQLGQGRSKAGSPDSGGRIYGWFRVANVSTAACAVPPAPGQVDVTAYGPADPSQITVVNHTSGDPATGLPATADDVPVVLAPGENYEVAFAWVPSAAGPGGCPPPSSPPVTPSPSGTPTDTSVPDPGGSNSADSPVSQTPPPGGPSGPTQPAAISLTHTPAAGAPVIAGPTLQGACAGTIYTTAPMAAAPSDTPPS